MLRQLQFINWQTKYSRLHETVPLQSTTQFLWSTEHLVQTFLLYFITEHSQSTSMPGDDYHTIIGLKITNIEEFVRLYLIEEKVPESKEQFQFSCPHIDLDYKEPYCCKCGKIAHICNIESNVYFYSKECSAEYKGKPVCDKKEPLSVAVQHVIDALRYQWDGPLLYRGWPINHLQEPRNECDWYLAIYAASGSTAISDISSKTLSDFESSLRTEELLSKYELVIAHSIVY